MVPKSEGRFFDEHLPTTPLVIAVLNFMRRKNREMQFVEKTVGRIGYPKWDKALTKSLVSQTEGRGNSEDSTDLTFIPFVRDNQDYVNATLIVKTNPRDTTYQYLCDWQYDDYGFDTTRSSMDAWDVFLVFATLDKQVFNRSQFRMLDSNLLSQQERSYIASTGKSFDSISVIYSLEPVTSLQSKSTYMLEFPECYIIQGCINSQYVAKNHRSTSSLPQCPPGTEPFSYTQCISNYLYIEVGGMGGGGDSGGGGGDGGSGGSGGGSAGGCTPPVCDSTAGRAFNVNPCEPGWEPILDEPVDPCDKIAAAKNDPVFRASFNDLKNRKSENKEYGYYENESGTFLFVEGPQIGQDEVEFITQGQVKIMLHSHRTSGLPIFSVRDFNQIAQLYNSNVLNLNTFIYGVATETGSYVLTIDDVNAFDNFIEDYVNLSNASRKLELEYQGYGIGNFSNNDLNIKRFIQLFSDLGAGVSLLKANDDFTNFSKMTVMNNTLIATPCN